MYLIVLRGINKQRIFEDNEDNRKFIEILGKHKETSGYQLYAYCLMSNRLHLLPSRRR
ncbi:MAG: transposase [Syntrophomonadaceae bacterium]|nr:transposase [Syntrophomonadaceae bacterium]